MQQPLSTSASSCTAERQPLVQAGWCRQTPMCHSMFRHRHDRGAEAAPSAGLLMRHVSGPTNLPHPLTYARRLEQAVMSTPGLLKVVASFLAILGLIGSHGFPQLDFTGPLVAHFEPAPCTACQWSTLTARLGPCRLHSCKERPEKPCTICGTGLDHDQLRCWAVVLLKVRACPCDPNWGCYKMFRQLCASAQAR